MGCRNGQKKAETATLKKCRDRSFTWCAEAGKMAFCIFLCRNGVIPRLRVAVGSWTLGCFFIVQIYCCTYYPITAERPRNMDSNLPNFQYLQMGYI